MQHVSFYMGATIYIYAVVNNANMSVCCQLWPPLPHPVSAAEGKRLRPRFRATAAVELLQVFFQPRWEGRNVY